MKHTEMREKEADVDFCRCPFFACRFMSIEDLEMHMATLGSNEEAYSEIAEELVAK